MSDPSDDTGGVLSRWSRRKLAARKQQESPEAPVVDPALSASLSPELNPSTDENLPANASADVPVSESPNEPEVELPDIDSLTEDSDYSAFMAPNVSSELRNLALRKLFKSSVFNVRDGLDDYDEDFTTFEKLGDIVTSDMRHHAERKEKERLLREQEELAKAEDDSAENLEVTEEELAESIDDEPSVEDLAQNAQDNQEPAPTIRPTDTDAQLMSGKIRRRPNDSA